MKISAIFFLVISILAFTGCDDVSHSDDADVVKDSGITVDPIEDLTDRIIKNPNDENLYIERAMRYTDKKLFDLAKRDVERALAIDSNATHIHTAMGEVFFKAAELRDARLAFEKAVALDAKNTEAFLKLGEVNFLLRRYPEAISAVNDALRVNDQLAKGYFLKGFVYKETGDTILAKSSFQTAVEVNPEYYDAYVELGNLFASEQNDLALDYFNTALNIRPKSAEAYYNKGIYYQTTGRIEEALETYRALTKADPNAFLGYYNTGYIYLVGYQSYDTALAYFDTVLTIQPAYIDAMYNKGLCYEEMGDDGLAEAVYRDILDMDPQYTLAAMGLERLLD